MNYKSLRQHYKRLQTLQHEVSEAIKSAVHIQSNLIQDFRQISVTSGILCVNLSLRRPSKDSKSSEAAAFCFREAVHTS